MNLFGSIHKGPIVQGMALLIIACLCGCTKKFDEFNTNKTKLTNPGLTELPYMFSKAQTTGSYTSGSYQTAQNLFADLYAQYFALTTPSFQSDRYVMRMDWLITHWVPIYTEVIPQLKFLLEKTDQGSAENALARIWWVYVFHRLTDYYGPIPYFKAGESLKSFPYDAQDKIYDDFFKQLDTALTVLKGNTDKTPYGDFDLIYKGKVNNWIKFNNTLRLRLALRISQVDAARAKTEAEKAVAAGVMTGTGDDALMLKTTAGLDYNGLARIAVWNEFRMSASMESVLKGYNDPRIAVYFQPASASKKYDGLRNGLTAAEQNRQPNTADYNSNAGTRWVTGSGGSWLSVAATPQNILHAAEAYFLRAEGALNGWNMDGTAKDLYESGIRTSMQQWGVTDADSITAYINSAATPMPPEDQQASPAINDYPIKWSADPAMQRKQIAQQKWIALFPDGMESWADVRRKQLPKLYPVVHSDNADLPPGKPIRRIPFLDVEKQNNSAAVQAAAPLLGGPDKASTPLWWDKN